MSKLEIAKIYNTSCRYNKISSPDYSEWKSRGEILAGTTEETMRSLYTRPHRGSIYEPATIHDIPQEVLEKSLILLLPSIRDLVAASLACLAWRPVAQKLIHSRLKIRDWRVESLVC
jgi:hypothetical protein